MDLEDIIISDNDILSGKTVFKGTRVHSETLFDHLEAGISIDDFLNDFPTVSKQQVLEILDNANKS